MGQTSSEVLNALVHRANNNPNQTKLHPSQPLNVIAGDGLDDPSPGDIMVDDGETNEPTEPSSEELVGMEDDDGDEGWGETKEICSICQIEQIVGTCSHCGIYLYGSGTYPSLPVQFDIKVRRRQ